MTNREFLLKTDGPEFAGELELNEDFMIKNLVICGFVGNCRTPTSLSDCIECQRAWLDAERSAPEGEFTARAI